MRPGTVVSVMVGPVRHVGIVTGVALDGEAMVISNSRRRGGVYEERLREFADGGRVREDGYPGRLAPEVVIERARSRIGARWSPFSNCEHFVRHAHGLPVQSPQLIQAGLVVGVLVLAVGWFRTGE